MISSSMMRVFPTRCTSLPRHYFHKTLFIPSSSLFTTKYSAINCADTRYSLASSVQQVAVKSPSPPASSSLSSSSIPADTQAETRSLKMQSTKKVQIDSNLTLWRASEAETSTSNDSQSKKVNEKLVILFAYMLPKERHIEKYRHMYHQHGFDVLTITTSPFQFFLPVIGAQKIASQLLSYLDNNINVYPSMVVHAFSVGGYQYSELVNLINTRSGDLTSDTLANSIKATIFDSPCDVDSVPYGLSHTVAGDTIVAKIFQAILNFTRFIFYPVSTKYHTAGANVFINQPLSCPSLFFASECDKMANINVIRTVVDTWTKKGVPVDLKCWQNTRHVSHYHAHPEEYVSLVEKLMRKVKLI